MKKSCLELNMYGIWWQMDKKVGIVISTWNRVDELKDVISSVYKQDYPNIEVVVVDNHSDDGTREYLDFAENNFKNFQYVITKDSNFTAMETLNMGFSIAKNLLYVDYILVLDDDVILEDYQTITKMVYTLESSFLNGIVACNVVTPQERLPQLEFKIALNEHLNIRDLPKKPFEVYDFVGACALFHADLFNGYDENFKLYWNEADTALDFISRGYKVIYDPNVTVLHLVSPKQRQFQNGVLLYLRNGNLVINKYLSFKNRLVLVPIRSLILILRNLIYFKDLKFTLKLIGCSIKSFINIFYMKNRMKCVNGEIQCKIDQAHTSFHFRKFYEWIFNYPIIEGL